MFRRLTLSRWQQFKSIDITFHDRLTIITGANGAGKTTILNLLARHNGWQSTVFTTPKLDVTTGVVRFFSRLFGGNQVQDSNSIGELEYEGNQKTNLSIQDSQSAATDVTFSRMIGVPSFYVPSHRSVYRYQPVSTIQLSKKRRANAFQEVFGSTVNRYFSGGHSESVSFLMKSTLIGWIIQGYGVSNGAKQVMPADAEQVANFEGFQEILRKVLPKTLGFQEIEVRNNEIVFVCNSGDDEFLLETASGGISSLIDLSWQIYMYSADNPRFVVLIDEVENHLHPTMQRRIMPDLVAAFPNVKFIVSTHSPLVVSSVQNSSVYALSYDETKKVISTKLDFGTSASSANQILEDVLGLSTTIPIWAQESLDSITSQFRNRFDEPGFETDFIGALKAAGLENFVPRAIERLVD